MAEGGKGWGDSKKKRAIENTLFRFEKIGFKKKQKKKQVSENILVDKKGLSLCLDFLQSFAGK